MSEATSHQSSAATPERPVAVIGGGIAGLTAAWTLQQRGIPVRLFEASPHLGGRIQSAEHGGCLEIGMQFYYSAYRETFKLLKAFGLKSQLSPIAIDGLIYWEGRMGSFSKTRPWLKVLTAGENFKLQRSIGSRLFSLLRLSPFEAREKDRLDTIDVADYFMARGNEAIFETAIRPMVNSYAFCEPERHSLAVVLKVVKLGAIAKTYGLRCGNDALPKAMAAKLDVVHGKVTRVHLANNAVDAVTYEGAESEITQAVSGVISAARAHEAAAFLSEAPELAAALGELSYSTIVLVNLHLDRPLSGKEWVYVMSRKAGHRAAFAIDLTRRVPSMFPDGNSVLQVDFATPVSDEIALLDDGAIVAQAVSDLEPFIPEIKSWVRETSVVRRVRQLPNFPVGTFGRIAEIRRLEAPINGLALAGDYLRSPLCESAVRSGIDAAAQF